MNIDLPEDTLYNLFNDRTLMEMITDEETFIEPTNEAVVNANTPRVPNGPTE